MAKLVSKKTTTTVTEEIAIVPAAPGEEKGHRFMKVYGYGTYRGSDGSELSKPQINLNGKWLAEAGFDVGAQIDVEVHENEIVILCCMAVIRKKSNTFFSGAQTGFNSVIHIEDYTGKEVVR